MSIKTNAEIIRDETIKGANTALRVGGNLVEIADDLLNKTINKNRFVCSQNNSVPISENVGILNIENYTDVNSIGAVSSFDGSNLTITPLLKDIEVKALIQTIGDFSIDRQFYFRDVNDPINIEFGNGLITNVVSSYGAYGFNSSNRLATAVVRAGTTVVLNLIHQTSAGNQKIKEGSFIQVKEI